MGKWHIGIVLGFVVIYSATVLITGHPTWIIPAGILALILLAYAGVNWSITHRQRAVHGDDVGAAMADNTDPIPSSHLIPDDIRPTGDTPEAHDELNPHDVPLSSPIRHAVEAQAGSDDAETRGNVEGAAGGPEQAAPVEDRTTARTGEPQRSASRAK